MKVSLEGSFYSQSRGMYWLATNQSNQHTSTYSRIQQQTKNPYYTTIHNEYAQENPRINPWICVLTPRRSPSNALPLHTEKQCTASGPLVVFHPCLWPLKSPGSILGEGRQTSRQPADANTSGQLCEQSCGSDSRISTIHFTDTTLLMLGRKWSNVRN